MTKTKDDYLVDAILCHKDLAEQGQALALAEDGIRIALKIAGYKNVDSMNQFERASALLDMAQEYKALTGTCKSGYRIIDDELCEPVAWERVDIDNEADICRAFVIARNFGRVYKEMTA